MKKGKNINYSLTENALDYIQEALARYNSFKVRRGINKKKILNTPF